MDFVKVKQEQFSDYEENEDQQPPIEMRQQIKQEPAVDYECVLPAIEFEEQKSWIDMFFCDFINCKFVSKRKDQLTAHRGTHTKPFKCDLCRKRFSINAQLTQHRLFNHENSDRFKCHICNKRYSRNTSLVNHLKLHDKPARIFKCGLCPKVFTLNRWLVAHRKLAHGKFSSNCVIHPAKLISISGIKNFVCDLCGSRFCELIAVKRHMKIHEEKKFKCEKCSATFVTTSNRRKHMSSFLGIEPMECQFCSSVYCSRILMIKHIGQCHQL